MPKIADGRVKRNWMPAASKLLQATASAEGAKGSVLLPTFMPQAFRNGGRTFYMRFSGFPSGCVAAPTAAIPL